MKYTNDEWIDIFKKIHGDKYDYSCSDCDNRDTKGNIKVKCHKHGEFIINPSKHAKGKGCYKCLQQERFINKATLLHNSLYSYDKVDYANPYAKVCITCKKHGDFFQTPSNHLIGYGCKECMKGKLSLSNNDFINRIKTIFNDRYDLSKTNYINYGTKVCLSCKIHGDFYKFPKDLYKGQGCQKCNMSTLENEIMTFLENNNIEYIYQCNSKHFKWLGLQSLDFYLPKYNVAIECQGEQHFKNNNTIFTEEKLKKTKECDKRKLDKCNENGVTLLYYSNLTINYPYKVFTDKKELLNEIYKRRVD